MKTALLEKLENPVIKRHVLTAILIFAFLVRVAWILCVDNPRVGDVTWFFDRAELILKGEGYHFHGVPTAFFPVGYSVFLAGLIAVFGKSWLVAELANAVMSTLLCFLTYTLGKRIFNASVGIIAALILAIYPNQIFYTSIVLSETLFSIFVTLFVLTLTTRSADLLSSHYFFRVGVLLGLTCLIRSTAVLLPVCLVFYWYWVKRVPPKQIAKSFSVVMLGVFFMLSPWITRNLITMKELVIVSNNGGMNFWMAHFRGGYKDPPMRFCGNWTYPAASSKAEVQSDRIAYLETIEYLLDHPFEPLIRFPYKLLRLYYADIDGLLINAGLPRVTSYKQIPSIMTQLPLPVPDWFKISLFYYSQAFYMVLLLFALLGIFVSRKTSNDYRKLLLFILAGWTLFHVVLFFPVGRYRFPVVPLIVLFSAYYIYYLLSLLDRMIYRKEVGDEFNVTA